MADKMLIDASHEEETRVVVVRGNRIEEFDFESQHKKQLRGNIYLAKVTRVEPSLQAAFIEYGGNRHGFLAFSEIHPDYYQIPVADRQALLDAEAAEAKEDDDDAEVDRPSKKKSRSRRGRGRSKKDKLAEASISDDTAGDDIAASDAESTESPTDVLPQNDPVSAASQGEDVASDDAKAPGDDNANSKPTVETASSEEPAAIADKNDGETREVSSAAEETDGSVSDDEVTPDKDAGEADGNDEGTPPKSIAAAVDTDSVSEPVKSKRARKQSDEDDDGDESEDDDATVESVGAEDALEEVPDRVRKQRRQYRIQEVIKRRQILLVQVVKEERGNKGAALTTYLSLAGRYSVLMPNTARGGGISRKITNVQDRKRLKDVARGLEVPQGMGVILRTAGANRTKGEIKRDFEYLMRLWDTVRNQTLTSTAPCLVYEEGSLIKRSIRDLYNKDIGEVIVSGENGYREAKDFMKMLMPSHAKAVQPYREVQPIFARSGIEAQLDKMLQPQVTLKSGGYIIINQTEALVSIDVNSGRSTKEHSIEDTALRTNLEAAEEVARQLRLRDLAGLIVIDFIDMEEKRNNRAVEKKLKECLRSDRARIQVGRISHFGLLEMSRQRIRASVLESTMQVCDTCGGTGYVRSISSLALHVLRTAEEHLLKKTTHNITLRTTPEIALYILNQKRDTIIEFEERFGLSIAVAADANVGLQYIVIDQGTPVDTPVVIEGAVVPFEADIDDEDSDAAGQDEDENGRKRKRRRRRRGGRNGEDREVAQSTDDEASEFASVSDNNQQDSGDEDGERRRKRRRRGKRGGKRNREQEGLETASSEDSGSGDTNETGLESAQADASADPVGVAGTGAEMITGEDGVQKAVEADKPKRQRSKRKKESEAPATATDEKDVVAEIIESSSTAAGAATDNAVEEKPAGSNRRRRSSSDPESSAPKLTSTTADAKEDIAEEKPKKAGWWQKRGFF